MVKLKIILKWVLFLILGYLLYSITGFIVYIGMSLLFDWISGLSRTWFTYISLGIAIPLLSLTLLVYGTTARLLFTLSPNRIAYWILSAVYMAISFHSVYQYCSVGLLPETVNTHTVQLPCWAYVLITILNCIVILTVGIVSRKATASTK